ncbi:MAG: MCE family protein [Methylobacteriaceae bacterium]|jgi:phospholipid/cholesterol/gamma-HCH transport system substrate-binding protein|nr:MCE family protein [Methylobacteriaceae bacterium]
MDTKANYALIGIFTLAVLAAAFGFVYWFAVTTSSAARFTFEVVFEGSVSGLANGSAVLFNGLKVGEVKALYLDPDNPKNVVALAVVSADTPVRSDTKGRLEYQGLTGAAQIALTGGSGDAAELPFVPGHDYQVIYAEKSDMQDLVETARAVARKADDVLSAVESIVRNNEEAISDTVGNVRKFSKALGDNAEGIDELFRKVGDATEKIGPLADKLAQLSSDLDAIVLSVDRGSIGNIVKNTDEFSGKLNKAADHLDEIVEGVQSFLGTAEGKEGSGAFADIREAARSVRELADNLNRQVDQISPGLARFSGPGLREFQAMASDARRALAELNQVLRNIERNPQQFIFGDRPQVPAYNGRR